MAPSVEMLLSIAQRYWRADKDYQFQQEASPETRRFQERWGEALAQITDWKAMIEELRQDLPGHVLGQLTATCDSCFRCGAYAPVEDLQPRGRWVVVGCMSILAPVYTVYGVRFEFRGRERSGREVLLGRLPPEMCAPAEAISKRIEQRFGVSRLSPEVVTTPVPLFVEPREPPETTLFHALFTAEPASVP
ncbi:hypothetical protein P2318_11720 [Myxococcaceae bacterium GXIMD 01537]